MHASLFDHTSARIFRFGSALGFTLLYLMAGALVALFTVGNEISLASVSVLLAWPALAAFWLLTALFYVVLAVAFITVAFLLLMWASYSWNRFNV